MSFRARLLFALMPAVLLPIIVLALVIRVEMTRRLTAQYDARVASLIAVIEDDLSRESARIDAAVAGIEQAMLSDNRFRRAAMDRIPAERTYLLDYAGSAMRLAGLTMLQIQDESGRIVSSGHFRNEYDRLDPRLLLRLRRLAGRTALVEMRAPDAPFLALARIDSVRMGDRLFLLVAGTTVESGMLEQLARGKELRVSLRYPGGGLASDALPEHGGEIGGRNSPADASEDAIAGTLDIPFIGLDRNGTASAEFRVTHDLEDLRALRKGVDRWVMLVTVVAAMIVLLLVAWLSSRISRPIADLAARTEQVDLDRLDIDFSSRRSDEIGVLSRGLERMTARLRASAALIRDAERRAAVGDLARQVTHDIKNGLTPVRNIVQHLLRLAREHPADLPGVLEERRQTLAGGLDYLERLASNYARLTPKRERRLCNLGAVLRGIVTDMPEPGRVRVHLEVDSGIFIMADAVSLRRIFENLVTNAIESLESEQGTVSIAAALSGDGRVRITVTDTGTGMSEERQGEIFNDFFTTKREGTGLGLSIVRRLVMDLDGSIAVESEPGRGSRFMVDLPAARRPDGDDRR